MKLLVSCLLLLVLAILVPLDLGTKYDTINHTDPVQSLKDFVGLRGRAHKRFVSQAVFHDHGEL